MNVNLHVERLELIGVDPNTIDRDAISEAIRAQILASYPAGGFVGDSLRSSSVPVIQDKIRNWEGSRKSVALQIGGVIGNCCLGHATAGPSPRGHGGGRLP